MNNDYPNQSDSPEVRSLTDSERIAEGKRISIENAATNARASLYSLHPRLWQEMQAKHKAEEDARINALDALHQAAEAVDNNATYEAEMNLLDQELEQQDKAELEDKSRNLVDEAMPMPSSQVQVEVPGVPIEPTLIDEARSMVDDAVMGDVDRYLENIGGPN
jgi:hypothetical protein